MVCVFTTDETEVPLFRLPVTPSERNSLPIGHGGCDLRCVDLFGEPDLDQRLVGDIALVGGDLDHLQQIDRQP